MAFEVVPDELRTHASHLDGLTDRLNTAVDAANTVVMDDSAYGLLCAFLPPIINKTTQNDATDALKSAVDGVTAIADNVRTAAQSYEETDQAHATPFKKELADGVGDDGSAVESQLSPLRGTHIGTTVRGEATAPESEGRVNETLRKVTSLPDAPAKQAGEIDMGEVPQSNGQVNETLRKLEQLPEGAQQ